MTWKVFATMTAIIMTAYGLAPVSAQPPRVVQIPDEALDAALVPLDSHTTRCDGAYGECDGSCFTKEVSDPYAPWTLLPELAGGVTITGWLDAGSAASADRNASRSLSPLTFNDRQNVTVNQAYAVIERGIDTTNGWDVGGRIDVLFGSGARLSSRVTRMKVSTLSPSDIRSVRSSRRSFTPRRVRSLVRYASLGRAARTTATSSPALLISPVALRLV